MQPHTPAARPHTPAARPHTPAARPCTPSSQSRTPFAELHACTSFNFLRGASSPQDMLNAAQELGITALACMDRDGFYGAPQVAEAARETGVATVFGAELSVAWPRPNAARHNLDAARHNPDAARHNPDAANTSTNPVLAVLCKGQEGYRRLSRTISSAAMAKPGKGTHHYPPSAELARIAGDHWYVLIDWRWLPDAPQLIKDFGAHNCLIELQHTMDPHDWDRNEALHSLAVAHGVVEIVSAVPTCAVPSHARLAAVKHAVKRQQSVAQAAFAAPPTGGRWLRGAREMLQLAGDCPWLQQAVHATARIAGECAFQLDLVAPNLPHCAVPDGHTEMSWLRHLVNIHGAKRYGPRPKRHGPWPDGSTADQKASQAWQVIDKELAVIEQLGFPGYFLIVHDLVDFCHRNGILCQGRGSAANSAVCFALGITSVDAVANNLLFERFLSPERDGPPDIDIDIESSRREEVIQYVYRRYGRDNAAQVANVMTYRRRGALRDAGRALGFSAGQVDAFQRGVAQPPEVLRDVAGQLVGHPRHVGIHSGGMVICDRPLADVVPVEWARMAGRSVVQWDKDDCAWVGLVKFDLLGLGMLEALQHVMELVRRRGVDVQLWQLQPTDPKVYDMLCAGDAVGVFQVESRAQLNALPRLRPRTFFDLVVQVGLIRPGPIQGGSVHPYIRRRHGAEPVTYEHPCLEPALRKTLGIPLFQEQLMQIAVDAAGFSAAEADSLRRAMGSKRSVAKMEVLRARFYEGLERTWGIVGSVADSLWDKVVSFASYGFPEAHAQSFAVLVYYSAWFKLYYPAEFCVALLRAQPMGFYSPQSLIADARRHGVGILGVDVNASGVEADVECGQVRVGLASVKGVGCEAAERIVAARSERPGGVFTAVGQLSREAGLSVAQVEQLGRAGALDCLGFTRRQAVWAAGIAATEKAGMLPGSSQVGAPSLPGMSAFELAAADVATTGVTPGGHPVELLRGLLDRWAAERGGVAVLAADRLRQVDSGTRIRVAGVVTHRQRPTTAQGVTFLGLEDETGLVNVVVSEGLWSRYRRVWAGARMVVVRGIVHNVQGATSVNADFVEEVALGVLKDIGRSRDFR